VLGTGIMGAGMARNLVIGAGLDVTVWNRSPDRARPLADAGARIATDVSRGRRGRDVVVTMLFDADSVAQVMEEALPAMAPDASWVQMSTVGPGGHRAAGRARGPPRRRLPRRARARHQGARRAGDADGAGRAGRRRSADAGDAGVRRDRVEDDLGGEQPGEGHKLKLVANSWVGMVTAGTGQAIALAGPSGWTRSCSSTRSPAARWTCRTRSSRASR
jgi:3-hydroxyisobutyrate dehydrogenase